ncbi:hypothetical protein ZWY2020_054006 [Hordeum vulgare]|nr:hypothetical protein ZWY2020_054006 [Hordeum vulgare]
MRRRHPANLSCRSDLSGPSNATALRISRANISSALARAALAGSAHRVERRGVVLQRARKPRLPSPAVQPRRLVLAEEQDGGVRAAHQPEEVGQRAAGLVAEQPGLSSVSVRVLVATGLGAGSAGAGGMTARPGD